jgi:hypothetical protein
MASKIQLCYIFIVIELTCISGIVFAQDFPAGEEPSVFDFQNGEFGWITLDRSIDKLVVAEGLMWNSRKGTHSRRLILDGGRVYLTGDSMKLDGCLVRVSGVISRDTIPPVQPGAQGNTEPVVRIVLKIGQIEKIDHVLSPEIITYEARAQSIRRKAVKVRGTEAKMMLQE